MSQDQQQPQPQQQQEDGEGMSAESPDSSASDVHGPSEKGQAPSLPEKQAAPPLATPSATMSSIATPSVGTTEKEKDGGSSLVTMTLSMPFRKRTRRKDDRSTSEGKYVTSSTGQPSALSVTSVKGPPAKKSRTSLFTKISHLLASCVSTSHRTHVVDVEEGPSHANNHQKDSEKASHKDAEVTKEASSSREPSSSSPGEEIPRAFVVLPRVSDDRKPVITSPPLLSIVPPAPTASDPDIVVPPTPTKQLLPLSETDGLTSGAVQPPGSTGEEGKTEHSTHTPSDTGDDSDASYSDDDMLMAGEDDEERLIRQGGAGIPVGPVRFL